MLPESDRRLLTEFLGECWHDDPIFREYIPGVEHIQFVELECSKCHGHYLKNRTFTTWQDTGDLKERIVEMGEWDEFIDFTLEEHGSLGPVFSNEAKFYKADYIDWLMDEIRFPELVAGWWWQEREVKECS